MVIFAQLDWLVGPPVTRLGGRRDSVTDSVTGGRDSGDEVTIVTLGGYPRPSDSVSPGDGVTPGGVTESRLPTNLVSLPTNQEDNQRNL